MSKVLSLKEDSFKGSDGATVICWKVELDDKTNPVPCYSAEASSLKIGEPLPEGWSVQTSAKGKDYLKVPKKGGGGFSGGGGSWRNSEAGERFVQERMDRRTALMQAIALFGPENRREAELYSVPFAERFYEWLRASAAGGTTTDPMAAKSVGGTEKAGSTPVVPPTVLVDEGGHVVDPLAGTTPSSTGEEQPDGEAGASPWPEEVGAEAHGLGDAPASETIHDHVEGRMLASGSFLCSICGDKMP